MLIVNHFNRPFIDNVLDLLREVDETFDQDFNEHQISNSKIYTV